MAFTLEDDSGVAGANAYVDATYVTDYLTDRGRETENSWSSLTSAQQQAAIIKATDYVEKRFGHRFIGYREFPDTPQGLEWPRLNAYDDEGYVISGVPDALKKAVAEYAVRAADAALLPDPSVDDTGRAVLTTRSKVGPIETEKIFEGGGRSDMLRAYPDADLLLRQLIASAGGGVIR